LAQSFTTAVSQRWKGVGFKGLGSPTFASLDTCADEGVPPAVALARQILPPAIQMAAYGSTPETAPLAGSYVPRWMSRSPPTLEV